MKNYTLKNLDCAECASRIEKSLARLPSVKSVSINFTTETMNIDTENMDEVIKTVKSIDPEVKIEESDGKPDIVEDEYKNYKALWTIGISVVIFVIGMFFRSRLHETPYSFAEYAVFLSAYLLSGWRVLSTAGKNILRGKVFDEHFLMTIATIGAIVIHAIPEAVGVMLFFKVGEFFENLSLARSRRSIKSLLEIRPEYANLKKNNIYKKVAPEEVKVGDIILVKPGERVPLDGEVINGNSMVDTSALTGESIPRSVKESDSILSGMIVNSGSLIVRVTKSYKDSSISRILDLVENAVTKKAQTEKFITTFARYYTPLVVFFAMMIAVIPPLIINGAVFQEWIYRALVVLVISCPCALVISVPLGYFGGIGHASRRGILIKGSNYIDALNKVKTVVFDKTGTLTHGIFKVIDVTTRNGFTPSEILKYAAFAESHSNHPIADSIREAYGQKVDPSIGKDHREISGHGIETVVLGKKVMVGNDRLLHREEIDHDICNFSNTVVHVVIDSQYAGYIVIGDAEKKDARFTVDELKKTGVKATVMLTGDNVQVAKYVSNRLGIDEYHAELLPEDKVKMLDDILKRKKRKEKVAFVGDGINDAPVLARADVGIAMGKTGSDAAIDTADVVLMTDALSKIPEALRVSKKTISIVYQNIILALVVKLIVVGLGITGMAGMWEAVFADMGVTLLAIFNTLRVLYPKGLR
ncbi:MAG: cadmium-translocating P-type ATPase [Spirochaetota bacterium]|nr:MAG: cadmium-translocating P-type ATPase [Spirochaetota bacterium]